MDFKSIGDYLILKKIGEGVFGSIYLAEHKFMKKKYVIKLLPEDISKDVNFVKNFEKDIGILAKLDHPSIVKLHNISCSEGRYFLVMDSVLNEDNEKVDLEQFLSVKQNFSERNLEIILKQIASALDYAHDNFIRSEPIIHGGLKLSNIFVKKNKNIHLFISDFAMNKLIGKKIVLKKNLESSLKNFYFLSPEQKKMEEVTIKTDSYAFGVLVYYLITKDYPEGYFEMPSKIAPHYKLNWDLLVCRCLHKDPSKRPTRLLDALNSSLFPENLSSSNIDVLSWNEVEKKVENAMQLSFEFSSDDKEEVDFNEPHPIIKPQKIDRPVYETDPSLIFQKELSVSHYEPKKEEIKDVKPLLTEMKIIPSGTYKRGSNNGARDERPAHTVTISSFALDIHPVTNEQFVRFLRTLGGEKDVNNNDIIRLRDSRIKKKGGSFIIESGYIKHPVVGVTWYGAVAYARWVGKRLPIEVEWEIASMGGLEESIYPFGDKIDHTLANFFSSDTTSVMSYPANGFGLYDMAGNIYEWCQDWYAYNYYDTSSQEPENPKGPVQGVYRVLRGGCWKSLKEDLRCAHRHRNNPGAFNSTYGFRCAAEVAK
ncbi:MAG: hypothetical protein AMS24_05370 [Chlamydiae bacterium SM23_39]|nr:MAG: hypothetical protein AMS24_05370 [Chlamydiae bacterium SM23_39]